MKYPKIPSPFMRHIDGPNKNKLDMGNWFRPEFKILADLPWTWTEKVNGTNIRIMWDGHKVRFGGRTDGAAIPAALIEVLMAAFPEELMEQQFGGDTATLYGEGYGARIASGSGVYSAHPSFILFDVMIPDVEGRQWWLERDNIVAVANGLGIDVVPLFMTDNVPAAIHAVRLGITSSWGNFPVEGLVGTAPKGLLSRGGERLQMKIKTEDFRHA